MTSPEVTLPNRNAKPPWIVPRSVLIGVAWTVLGGAVGYGLIYAVRLYCAPRLVISTTRIDLGEVRPHQTVTEIVTLINSGRRPVRIDVIQSSCGCTVANLSERRLAIGQQVPMEIEFTASSSSFSTATVTVASNDPVNPVQTILIEARMPPIATVSPSAVRFDAGDRSRLPAMQRLQMSFTRSDMLGDGNDIIAKTDCDFLRVRIDTTSRLLTAFAEVTLLDTCPTGSFKTTIHLQDQKGFVNETAFVEARVGSRYFFPHSPIVVTDLSQDQGRPMVHEIELCRRVDVPGVITRVWLDSVLRTILNADFVESENKTEIRITDVKQPAPIAARPRVFEGFLAVNIEGEVHEEFRIPVIWSRSSE
jgi:hypothetical protein